MVDDDTSIRLELQSYLQGFGITAQAAANAAEMRLLMATTAFDVVILDIMLPDQSGLSLCKWVTETFSAAVIMLTAHGDPASRVLGLEMGADDYLAKPFEPRELVAHIHAVLRRGRLSGLDADHPMRHWWRDTLFKRLFVLMWAALFVSHFAAYAIVSLVISWANGSDPDFRGGPRPLPTTPRLPSGPVQTDTQASRMRRHADANMRTCSSRTQPKKRLKTMKFYDSVGPNPRVVRIFAAERGVALEKIAVDLRGGENRQPAYLAKNPGGQLPALEFDDGFVLAEITAICEYLDEIASTGASLIGSNALERAETRMWVRRIDLYILEPIGSGFRYAEGLKMFQTRMRCIPQAADDLKLMAQEKLTWLNGLMAGKEFVCGNRLTLADILLFVFLDFGKNVGQPLNTANANIIAHYERMKARPSSAA